MAFPLTHLLVAHQFAKKIGMSDAQPVAQLLIGSIAPDAIHYRKEFDGANMKNIGPAKKITHLCPVSDERWGQVTDNIGWIKSVQNFLHAHPGDAFALGYAVHILTDICNNQTLWTDFRTNHPDEAAKGYASDYYKDLRNISIRTYQEGSAVDEIFALLETATPAGIPGLITADETAAIKKSLLAERDENVNLPPASQAYTFVTWDDTANFIHTATNFCVKQLPPQAYS